jgi:hypothetical protein
MDDSYEESFGLVFYTIVISIIWFTAGFTIGAKFESESFKSEAVVQGVAEYIPDEKGNPVWQWKK